MKYTQGLLDQNIVQAVIVILGYLFISLLIILDLARLSSLLFYKQGKSEVLMQAKKGAKHKTSETSERLLKGNNRWKEISGIYGLGFGAVAFYFLYVLLFNRQFPISILGFLYLAGFTFLIITFFILADFILRNFRIKALSRNGLWRLFIGELLILVTIITMYLSN